MEVKITGINMKKARINDKMYDVVDATTYLSNPELYDSSYTAIQINDMVLPIINKLDMDSAKVGIVPDLLISFYNPPSEEDKGMYDEKNIIDFSNINNMKELISKSTMVRNLENEILVNSDNITEIKIDSNDSEEMKGLKEAINCKECDINLYAPRFNGNFPNDVRILKDPTITLSKIKKYGNALDIKITMSFEDKNPSVPNPIGKVITVELTGGSDDE